jgi:DUF971 family protein
MVMKTDPTKPVELKKLGQDQFKIRWEDGHISTYSFQHLRQNCGCAACRNEITGEKILDPHTVPSDLKGLRVDLVGNYALHFSFSDHHETGIYPYRILRAICPCDECRS